MTKIKYQEVLRHDDRRPDQQRHRLEGVIAELTTMCNEIKKEMD